MNLIKSKGLSVSLAVFELLQDISEQGGESVCIGTFTNCRECGLTYMCSAENGKTFTYCTYEHRNSDSIIINGCEGFISLNGELPYAKNDKWSYLAEFKWNQHLDCAEKLNSLIVDFFNKNKKEAFEKVRPSNVRTR